MARDRPSPYGEEVAFFRSVGASPASSIVTMCVSASVVCDRLITNGSRSGDPDLQGLEREHWRGKPARMRVWHPRAQALR